ncbi:MAG: hypothetical protein GZ085_04905 [Sulfuriferula multivorans]|uniref:Uncharacterized protein n=1 Tax=Sulfuriferula multivorans TaxID=1559896 RepID=A0A7C9P8E2_9PROT|nr:hypothetical protein [Sulfuriferula multivorans]
MNTHLTAFDSHHLLGESATHPLARLGVPHKGTPIHYGQKPVWSRMRLALSLLVAPQGDSDPLRAKARVKSYASPGLPPRRFALKDSDPLWAEAHVESYAPDTRPDAPSGASNYGFQVR